MLTTALFIIPFLIWMWLIFFRRFFWKTDQFLCHEDPSNAITSKETEWPEVVIVIPARNEATVIRQSLCTVLEQDYPGRFQVILVDDSSKDSTVATAQATARERNGVRRFTVIQSTTVPVGWTGKLWAMNHGLQQADRLMPAARYVLLTDADISYEPWVLRALVRKAEDKGRHLVSVMALLRSDSRWARLLIPAFVFFFQKLYPFPAVNDPLDTTAAAAGGCLLVRRNTLKRAGNLVLIRDRIIDDCALAQLIKSRGSIWLGLSTAVRSLRPHDSLHEIWTLVTRTAFVQLKCRISYLAGTLLGMALTYLTAPAALVVGLLTRNFELFIGGLVVLGLMSLAYRPTLRLYGQPSWAGLFLPLAACLYTVMTVDSAFLFLSGHGAKWKGRTVVHAAQRKRSQSIQAVTNQTQTSFFWAIALLRREQRFAMFSIYAYCRTIDDIADAVTDPVEQSISLNWWREEIARLYEGKNPRHPIAVALEGAVRRFNLRYEDCTAIIDGVAMDVEGPLQAPSLAMLDMYCDKVASAVGRLSVQVFGLPVSTGDHLSHTLGRALQLTNILRDIAEDAACGRLYLPCELLEAHGIAANAPLANILQHPQLPQVCGALGKMARRYFTAAEQVLAGCPRQRVKAARLMKAVYQIYLTRLEKNGFRHTAQRLSLSRWEKLRLVIRYMLI